MGAIQFWMVPAANVPQSRSLLLVVPPQCGLLEGFSTGLIAIANYVRRHQADVEVRLLDFSLLSELALGEAISSAVLAARGRVFVGITGTTASYQSMLTTARLFKAAQPSSVVVMGGHHVTSQDDIVLANHSDCIDVIVRGEGEVAMTGLLNEYPRLSAVPNISYLDNGGLRRNPDCALLTQKQLDELEPSFAGGGLQSAPGKFDKITYVSARGCPLSCAFCVVRSTVIRAKTIDGVIKDLRYLVETLGYSEIAIEDNFFAHGPSRTIRLCAAIESLRKELSFTWDCQTRVESMRRDDVVQAMARAGCAAAYLGVEALVAKHLLYLGKASEPDRYLKQLEEAVLPKMLGAGIDVYLNLQLGLPAETDADREETITFLRRLGAIALRYQREITLFPQLNVLYPGTPHYEMALERGQFGELGAQVFESFTMWEAKEEPILRYLGEHFAHGVGGIPLGLLDGAKLAAGRFQVSPSALSNISTQLRRMDSISGVRLFRYGRYLGKPQNFERADA